MMQRALGEHATPEHRALSMCLLSSSRASAAVISFPLHSVMTNRREASTSGSSGIPTRTLHDTYPRWAASGAQHALGATGYW
jgi:hypothetical protein